MFGDIIQPTHLIFVLVVALLVLGPKRLPEVGRQLGRGMRDFRQGLHGVESEARGLFRDALDEPTAHTPAAATPTGFSAATTAAPSPSPHFVISPEPEPEPASASSPHVVITPEPKLDPASPPHMVISPDPQIAPAD